MRIVIDMQGAQTKSRCCGMGRYFLLLSLAIARNANAHEVWIVLNAAFPKSILDIRRALTGVIPDDRIRVFEVPTPVAGHDPANAWRMSVAEKIREHFIVSLKPDILLTTASLSAEWSDNVVTTVISPQNQAKTCLFLNENIASFFDSENNDNPTFYQWCLRRLQSFSQANVIITTTESIKLDVIKRLGVAEKKVLVIEHNQENSDSNIAALKVLDACQLVYQQSEQEKNHSVKNLDFQDSRPRLAFISPLPPEKTGIADYSAELLPELARYYHIELITDQEGVANLWPEFDFPVRSVAWFKLHYHHYERVLYHFGNSFFHQHMFEMLHKAPGVVVLHDFFLSHVLENMQATQYQSFAWTNALFASHGYTAMLQHVQASEFKSAVWNYPCNLDVLQAALGIIIHTENSRQLAAQWYGEQVGMDWRVIPLLRFPALEIAKNTARQTLDLSKEKFIVCSFGMLGPTKLNQQLLNAWLSSSLSKNEHCLLVFVGENSEGEYAEKLLKTIKKSSVGDRILITGWADATIFHHYLAAADIGVQLRTLSRGETSAAVLDCMNYGLPTIVNANGSMADLPEDAVWMLPDEFSNSELVHALETLWQDSEQRNQLAIRAQEVIRTQHAPSACANQYAQAIESIYLQAPTNRRTLIDSIASLDNMPSHNSALELVAKSVAASFSPKPSQRQLLIDISVVVHHDLKSGIERVVRAQLMELIKQPPLGFRIEPVYLTAQSGKWHYRYARAYTCKMLGIQPANLFDEPIDIYQGDIFYGLDFSPVGVINAAKSGIYLNWKAIGVSINFLVYDLLPVLKPEFFPDSADITHAAWLKTIADFSARLICISNAVADELRLWLKNNISASRNQLTIHTIHLGADIVASLPSIGLAYNTTEVLNKISAAPTFIMVGTIEPRKGHLQTLAAFEILWKQGHQINLVVIGKEGWGALPDERRRTIPQIVAKLRNHIELNNRLFWLEGISDEYLEKVYAISTCLIAASEGEGFGLPLIEAAQHKLPIIARDIPVFREVAGEHAYYFAALDPEGLSSTIINWLKIHQTGEHPKSEPMPWLRWHDSASQLSVLLANTVSEDSAKTPSGELLIFERKQKLYVDISVVYRDDLKTGIQRVVRAVLSELLKKPPEDYSICPVYLTDTSGVWEYYPVPFYSITEKDTSISPEYGDILLGLDFAAGYVTEAFKQGSYKKLMDSGMLVYFVLYDLLPVLAPQFFSPEASKGHEQWLKCICQSDGVVCISSSVADEFIEWTQAHNQTLSDSFIVKYFHLGADINSSMPSNGMPNNAEFTLNVLSLRPSFLMVGTIEPRKGYAQALSAFEKLWQQNLDANLVIIGKQGWHMDTLAHRLRHHCELGNRLFWLEGISDEYLEKVYAISTCLIAASEGEGFGLPLIEAAQHKLPIIARDIPVFREVTGEQAYYFNGLEPQVLADTIKHWLILNAENNAPQSNDIPWLTWEESAANLLQLLLKKTYN